MPIQELPTINLLIVGGGISGLLLSILLERKGYNTTLVEKSTEWKPIGGGITLTLNGVKMLQDIGLLDSIKPYANEISHVDITDQLGKKLSTFDLAGYAEAYAKTYTVLRHDMHHALISHLSDTRIHLGTSCTAIVDEGDKVKVSFTNKPECSYDLVVGCDGINSFVRRTLFGDKINDYCGYASWRFIAKGVKVQQDTLTEMWSVGKRFGIVPLKGNKIHCFASVNTQQNSEANKKISLHDFRVLFSCFGGYVPDLLGAIKNNCDLMYNDLEDVHLKQFYKGRLLLIGDAAHGMTPNMTQGASMAIEDAVVLAASLTDKWNIENSLKRFQSERWPRTRSIQKKSNLLGKIGQLKNPHLCRLRNYCWQRIPDRWIQNDLKKLLINSGPDLH
ncbi:FAD-dependent monooxygenase [Flavipsychrobacter stenotrophus]|nr:FAD-dependent monooxygenase [Flavipsychrobacter stenotrophus]